MVIDRIEGDVAVVELGEGAFIDVPLARIEGKARDGAVLAAHEGGYAVDEDATAARRAALQAKAARLFKRRADAGDPSS